MDTSSVNFIKTFRGISIYRDPYMQDSKQLLFGLKGKEVSDPGPIFVPFENFKNIKPSAIEKDEVDKILKEQVKNRKFSDYTFVVCNIDDDKIPELEKFISNNLDKI